MKLYTRQQKRFRERRPAQGSLEKRLKTLFQRAWRAHHQLDRKADNWQAELDELTRLQKATSRRRRKRDEVNFATLLDIQEALERFIARHPVLRETSKAERRRAIAEARRTRKAEKMTPPSRLPGVDDVNLDPQAQRPADQPDRELQTFYDQFERATERPKVEEAA